MANKIIGYLTKRNVVSVGLILLGLAQAVQYRHFKIDWQAFSLILCGGVSLLIKIEDLGSLFESLEFGKTKLLFRKTQALNQSVQEALESQSTGGGVALTPIFAAESATEQPAKEKTLSSDWTGTSYASVLEAVSRHKDVGLIKLSVEIELALARLCERTGIKVPRTGIIWGKAITDLMARDILGPDTGRALREFRDVRNSIIHASSSTKPSELAIASTIDSGLQLLKILEQIQVSS